MWRVEKVGEVYCIVYVQIVFQEQELFTLFLFCGRETPGLALPGAVIGVWGFRSNSNNRSIT